MYQNNKLKPFAEMPESFEGLKDEGVYYVDKTGFIPYLLSQKRKICVVTRPRRFGKTLMLRMLQTFFEYRLDKDGNPVDHRPYFEGLQVMEAGEDVLKEMGQYPVISLSFKNVFGDSFEEIVSMLNDAVAAACVAHGQWITASGKLSTAQAQCLQSFIDGKASEDDLQKYLRLYTQWLKDVTGRESVILLDEYDVPLQKAAIYDMHNPESKLFDKVVGIIGKFISSGFKSNSNLAYGIIAGCMRVAKESIFTGMNNPGVIDVLSDDIPDEYWGFTEAEVKKMLAYYEIDSWYDRIEQWYDGYLYGGRKVFNPWSLLNAIRGIVHGSGENAIKPYWGQTSGNDIIDDIIDKNPQHREALASLMTGETMTVPVFDHLSYRDLRQNPDAIWSFLLYTGYLKSVQAGKDSRNRMCVEVAVPNVEIWTIMDSSMERWWKNIELQSFDARPLLKAMQSGDIASMEREIHLVLDHGVSCFDYNEAFYHGTLYALMLTVADRVKSNGAFGLGRPDIVVFWHETAFVLELKRVSGEELDRTKRQNRAKRERDIIEICLNQKLDEAERQIVDHAYAEGVFDEYPVIREVVCYGIAFCKKRCMVRAVAMK